MEKTQEEALKRAFVLLKAAGVRYVILTNDGQTFGDLPIAEDKPAKKPRQRSNVPKEFRDAYRAVLQQMQPGDCKRFPIGEYDKNHIRGGITGWCSNAWGNKSYISTILKDTNEVEILRVE